MPADSVRGSTLLRYILFVPGLTFLMWVFLNSTLFGISERADKYLQDLFNTYLATSVYPDDHQQDTAVLLLTDEVVDSVLQGQWPAPYSFHASILDDLLVHRPRAVFIDFFWMNQHKPGAGYLVSVLLQYRDAEVPVYLAVPRDDWLEARWPELVGLVHPVSPHVVLDPADYLVRSYSQQVNGVRSAAFAIAEDEFGISAAHRGPLEVFWGTADNPRNQAWMQAEGEPTNNLIGTLLHGFESVSTPIPYSTTVLVRDLLNPVAETEDEALRALDEHLQDRIIIYGASLSGIQDMVFTPTRAILPGVYYHAMAMDNLLTWGDGFKAAVPSRGGAEYAATLLTGLQLSMLLLVALLVCYLKLHSSKGAATETGQAMDQKKLRWSREWWREVSIKLAVLAVVTLGCAIQFFVLDLSVAVWAGFLEIIGIGVILERVDAGKRLMLFFRYEVPGFIAWCSRKLKGKGVQDA